MGTTTSDLEFNESCYTLAGGARLRAIMWDEMGRSWAAEAAANQAREWLDQVRR